jgi:hypothetical protein
LGSPSLTASTMIAQIEMAGQGQMSQGGVPVDIVRSNNWRSSNRTLRFCNLLRSGSYGALTGTQRNTTTLSDVVVTVWVNVELVAVKVVT